jgi:putative ABC transport system substrate-binding protein
MKRRTLLAFLSCSLVILPLPALAQKELPRVVWVSLYDARTVEAFVKAFREGMQQQGYVDGQNVQIKVALGQFSREKLEDLAAEVVQERPAVIVAHGYAVRPVTRHTKTIPVVSGFSGDLVQAKLIESYAHPGGNVTGIQFLAPELVGKRLELLKELLPRLNHVAVIADPGHAGEALERAASQTAADKLRIRMDYYPVKSVQEVDAGLESAHASGGQALLVFPDSTTFAKRERIATFAIERRLPTISGWDVYAEAGMLMMYGPSLKACWSRTAYYVSRILKGANPAEIPVEMPNTVEMIVNLRTAKALGINIPQSLLLRADRVIE